jgi:hypothetical protein
MATAIQWNCTDGEMDITQVTRLKEPRVETGTKMPPSHGTTKVPFNFPKSKKDVDPEAKLSL